MDINEIMYGNCFDVAKLFRKKAINLVATSPPYAQQREKQYGGIPPEQYPQWTVDWCSAFIDALVDNGSIAIVIRPNVWKGQISDYVLRTRLAMRDAGFIECDELIWIKPDSPPMGHKFRPRRAWESILWFSKVEQPFCDPKANGAFSDRLGLETTKGVGDYKDGISPARSGIARSRDYVEVGTGMVDKSPDNTHPAQFPEKLAAWIIRLLCPKDGFVVDPFVGSGTTLVACEKLNQQENYNLQYCGIDTVEEYCNIAKNRLMRARKKPTDASGG